MSQLNPEQLYLVERAQYTYPGINLSEADRKQLDELDREISNLSFEFHQQCMSSDLHPPWIPITKDELHSIQVPLNQYPETRNDGPGRQLMMKVDNMSTSSVLHWSESRDLRRRVYEARYTR